MTHRPASTTPAPLSTTTRSPLTFSFFAKKHHHRRYFSTESESSAKARAATRGVLQRPPSLRMPLVLAIFTGTLVGGGAGFHYLDKYRREWEARQIEALTDRALALEALKKKREDAAQGLNQSTTHTSHLA